MKDNILAMTPQEIANACEDAATVLEGNWTQGYWFKNGSYCLEGALAAALDFESADLENNPDRQLLLECPVYAAILTTLNEGLDPEYDGVYDELPNWNDSDGREEQEVLDLLHMTAKRVMGVPR